MPWLNVDGFQISARLGSQRTQHGQTGQLTAAFSGKLRSTVRNAPTSWPVVTSPLSQSDALVLLSLISSGRKVKVYGDLMNRPSVSDRIDCFLEPGGAGWNKYADGTRGALSFTVREAAPSGLVFRYVAGYGGLNFARGDQNATYRDEDGVLQTVAADAEIRDGAYFLNPVTGLYERSLLTEVGRTNEFTQSEDLTHADWTAVGLSTRTANQATGPDGTVTLDELVEDSGNSGHRVYQTPTLTADGDYAISAWFMANTRTWGLLWMAEVGGTSTNYVRAWFNLSTGAIGTTAAGGTGALGFATIEDWTDVAPGLYRCTLTGSVGNSVTSIVGSVSMASADNTLTYTGDGSSSLYAGFAQIEDGPVATSYVPTTTAAISRADEYGYWDLATVAPAFSKPTAGVIYWKWIAQYDDDGGLTNPNVWHIGDNGGGTPRMRLFQNGTGFSFYHNNGTTNNSDSVTASTNAGDLVEAFVALNASGGGTLGVSVNEGAVASQSLTATALASAWAGTLLYAGNHPSWDSVVATLAAKIMLGIPSGDDDFVMSFMRHA